MAMLGHKAQQYGSTFVKVDRFEPASQVCSACGRRDGPKPLSARDWTCPARGTRHDRDYNVAKNVKAAAGLVAPAACRAPVGPEPDLVPR
ncbi:zinc ribbon domain-containing protein [Streptomyces sp. NPDC004685]